MYKLFIILSFSISVTICILPGSNLKVGEACEPADPVHKVCHPGSKCHPTKKICDCSDSEDGLWKRTWEGNQCKLLPESRCVQILQEFNHCVSNSRCAKVRNGTSKLPCAKNAPCDLGEFACKCQNGKTCLSVKVEAPPLTQSGRSANSPKRAQKNITPRPGGRSTGKVKNPPHTKSGRSFGAHTHAPPSSRGRGFGARTHAPPFSRGRSFGAHTHAPPSSRGRNLGTSHPPPSFVRKHSASPPRQSSTSARNAGKPLNKHVKQSAAHPPNQMARKVGSVNANLTDGRTKKAPVETTISSINGNAKGRSADSIGNSSNSTKLQVAFDKLIVETEAAANTSAMAEPTTEKVLWVKTVEDEDELKRVLDAVERTRKAR